MLRRAERINQSRDFKHNYQCGRRIVGKYCILFVSENEFLHHRFGIVCSKKVGKAVERNLARRRLREIIRQHRKTWSGSRDIVIVARASIKKAAYVEIEKDLLTLMGRAGF